MEHSTSCHTLVHMTSENQTISLEKCDGVRFADGTVGPASAAIGSLAELGSHVAGLVQLASMVLSPLVSSNCQWGSCPAPIKAEYFLEPG